MGAGLFAGAPPEPVWRLEISKLREIFHDGGAGGVRVDDLVIIISARQPVDLRDTPFSTVETGGKARCIRGVFVGAREPLGVWIAMDDEIFHCFFRDAEGIFQRQKGVDDRGRVDGSDAGFSFHGGDGRGDFRQLFSVGGLNGEPDGGNGFSAPEVVHQGGGDDDFFHAVFSSFR